MKVPPLSLLDTNVLFLLVKGGRRATFLRDTYGFNLAATWPLVCVVTHGELRSLARYNGWGDKKAEALEVALRNVITVDINRPDVIGAYVEVDLASRRRPTGSAIKMEKTTSGSQPSLAPPEPRCTRRITTSIISKAISFGG